MQESNIYRFIPNIGLQNINLKKLNANFSFLSRDLLQFSFYKSGGLSSGDAVFIYIPDDITILKWVAGSCQPATLLADIKVCEENNFPQTVSIAGENKISLLNSHFSGSDDLQGWSCFIQGKSWLQCLLQNVSDTERLEIALIINK
jgi:hypothetical protein